MGKTSSNLRTDSKKIALYLNGIASSYIQNEINYYLDKNIEVILVSNTALNHQNFKGEIENIVVDFNGYTRKNVIRKNFFLITKILFSELLSRKTTLRYLKSFGAQLSILLRSVYVAQSLASDSRLNESKIHVSYWMDDWATVLAVMKEKRMIEKFYSRAHGADLYEERMVKTGRQPFRKFQLKQISQVFCVSKMGKKYMQEQYPNHVDKIGHLYLGTPDPIQVKEGKRDNEKFTILTIGLVRNIKRFHLVPQLLELLDFPARWVHIGDDKIAHNDSTRQEYEAMREYISNHDNLDIHFLGEMSPNEVLIYYAEHRVDLLLSLSETEGLPVSMMEAISYGVPIVSTDVGGCREIVKQENGFLVDTNLDFNEIIEKISMIHSGNLDATKEKRISFWKENFSLNHNLNKFLRLIQKEN